MILERLKDEEWYMNRHHHPKWTHQIWFHPVTSQILLWASLVMPMTKLRRLFCAFSPAFHSLLLHPQRTSSFDNTMLSCLSLHCASASFFSFILTYVSKQPVSSDESQWLKYYANQSATGTYLLSPRLRYLMMEPNRKFKGLEFDVWQHTGSTKHCQGLALADPCTVQS